MGIMLLSSRKLGLLLVMIFFVLFVHFLAPGDCSSKAIFLWLVCLLRLSKSYLGFLVFRKGIFLFGLIIGIRWVLWWRCLGDGLFMILVLVFMLGWPMTIVFAQMFPDEIKDKQQLQRFLGSLNYLADFYKDLAKDAKPFICKACTKAVQRIKMKAKELPCLAIPHPNAFKIVETSASEYGYGDILKQELGGKTSLLLSSSTKRLTADSVSSNLKTMDNGYKRITRMLASFIKAEHWGSDLELVDQIYLRDHQSPTINSLKSRRWFETILIETGCARITHYYKSNKTISYSMLIILDVFSHQGWGDNLFREQKFKDPRVRPNSYHFFGYILAWIEILNYQNLNYGHSWFIKLSITTKDFSRVPIPCWFQQSLLNFGIVGYALPECVLEASNKFYQHNKKKVALELSFLYFLTLYQVPWILTWEYQLMKIPLRLNDKGKEKEVISTSSKSSKEEKEVLSLAKALLKEGTSPATIKSNLASCKPQLATEEEDDKDSEEMSF
ncbi:hypothetical protein ACOSQ3_003118 [Xanthoceras sorbifolium]